MGDPATHWDDVWASKAPDDTSWFQPDSEPCSEMIRTWSEPTSHVAIVGAGVSRLVVDLVARGYRRIEAIDISSAALDRLRVELATSQAGAAGLDAVRLRRADVRSVSFDEPVDLWHDRATFHFLTEAADRAAYAGTVAQAVRLGGHAVMATFALDGPEQCSGLPVARYDAASLAAELGDAFTPVAKRDHRHVTPWGVVQPFVYVVLRRVR